MDFSLVMPIRDDLDVLRRSLPRVARAAERYGRAEIILVDNGSVDGSYEWVRDHYGSVADIYSYTGAHVGAVRNFGAERARGEFLCFVDADCLVENDHLEVAALTFEEVDAAATGARYSLPGDPSWVESTWHRLHRTGREGYVKFLSGGNLIVRSSAFWDVEGFDGGLVTGEDAAFCQALRDSGHRIYQNPSLRVVHLGNPKSIGDFYRKQRWYALGGFGTVRSGAIDKPLVGSFAHLCLLVAGIPIAVSSGWKMSLAGIFVGLTCILGVPAAAVVFRWSEIGRIVRPLRSVVLYEVFFIARIVGTALQLTGNETGWRPSRGDDSADRQRRHEEPDR